ncbi:hypothetical protein JOQ06_005223 [Pogonophryne albipinna]|uniref:Uncharacterized protein n=1 Tax=Pogonophryne albipinna TaxID=1090488 RepID=A0AAD6BDG9_9TELE|nr:hypothetical protein JOQ06_005223 [Pogonophryne albipinna]
MGSGAASKPNKRLLCLERRPERKAGRYYRSQEITDVSNVSSFCELWFWVPKGEIKQTPLVSRTSVEQLQANVILDSFNSLFDNFSVKED